jgi:stage V sporulation protein B
MGKDKFLKGALILTVAGLMVKVIGSVNRILLSRLLGGEGIGLYQMAYPFYLLMLSICSAGVPVAVSIIVAEKVAKNDYAQAHRIFKVTLGLMAVFGLCFALILYGLAGYFITSGWIRDGRAYYALVVLTPAVFFSSILASFRGYFQGYQIMTPPAISQILEQLVRVLVMIGLAWFLLPNGLEYAAAGAAFGAVPGGLTGLAVLTWFYRKARKEWKLKIEEQIETVEESVGTIARRLVRLAIPVSCANLLIPVTSSIDMLLVPNGLGRAGFGVEAATTMFGYLTGMAQPLMMMATIPTMSLAASLVPAVSEACTLQRPDEILRKTTSALKICMLVVIPASVGMWTLAGPISGTLYGTMKAAPVIAHLAPSIAFLGIFQVTTGALQGIGKTAVPMWNMLFGAVVKAVAVWQLTSVAAFHILGAAWASNLNFAVVALINIFFLYRSGIPFPVRDSLKILLASVCMGMAGKAVSVFFMDKGGIVAALLSGMAVSVLVYAAAVVLLGCLTREEAVQLPVIGKIVKAFWNVE